MRDVLIFGSFALPAKVGRHRLERCSV